MKLQMLFMTAVLGIAAIHLLFNLVHYLARFKSIPVRESSNEKAHDGWYVFFDTSVLYGDRVHEPAGLDVADLASDVEPSPAHEEICHPQKSFA